MNPNSEAFRKHVARMAFEAGIEWTAYEMGKSGLPFYECLAKAKELIGVRKHDKEMMRRHIRAMHKAGQEMRRNGGRR